MRIAEFQLERQVWLKNKYKKFLKTWLPTLFAEKRRKIVKVRNLGKSLWNEKGRRVNEWESAREPHTGGQEKEQNSYFGIKFFLNIASSSSALVDYVISLKINKSLHFTRKQWEKKYNYELKPGSYSAVQWNVIYSVGPSSQYTFFF